MLDSVGEVFDLSGALRRIRRIADLSQRELAGAAGISVSAVAHAEAGSRNLPVSALARAATGAGLRLALLDEAGDEIACMTSDAVRDLGRRRFPAHLDTVYSEERVDRYEHRRNRPQPWYTFDRLRETRDAERSRRGTPEDHQVPQPGDSPQDRRRQRRAEQRQRAREELLRRFEAGELGRVRDEFTCACPPQCAELDEGLRPVHTPECPCRCDIG